MATTNNLTKTQLSRKLNISRPTLDKYEKTGTLRHQKWCNYYTFSGCRTLNCHPCNCEPYIVKDKNIM